MGPLIIHNPEEDPHVDDYDEEYEVSVSDLYVIPQDVNIRLCLQLILVLRCRYHTESASVVAKLHAIPALEVRLKPANLYTSMYAGRLMLKQYLQAVPDNILINGRGSFDCDTVELGDEDECKSNQPIPQFKFEAGKRYRLRLINAGAISNIRFSIDNHKLTIIEVLD
jgi:FtsP/CotA-like multicopper oxidase with cupredoxin domain